MGFFDFLKPSKEVQKEILKLEKLEDWITSKKESNKNEEEQIIKEIKEHLSILLSNLDEKIPVLEKIDVKQIKADERAKFIVRENLNKYIFYIKKLTDNLKKINSDNSRILEDFIDRINLVFSDFEQKSSMNFEKATFLIGKDLGDAKEHISSFFRSLKRILSQNQDFIKLLKIIEIIEERLYEIKAVESIKSDIHKSLLEISEETSNLKSNKEILKERIVKIKSSGEYAVEVLAKQEIEKNNNELEKEIYELKQMIDFKTLGNTLHSDSKKMSLINECQSNFSRFFEGDNGRSIIFILESANLEHSFISEKISKIMLKKREMQNKIREIYGKETKKIVDFERDIREMDTEMENIESLRLKEEKKLEKLDEEINELINSIKTELASINIELVEGE